VYLAQRRSQEFSCEPNFGRGNSVHYRYPPLPAPLGCASDWKSFDVPMCVLNAYVFSIEPAAAGPRHMLLSWIGDRGGGGGGSVGCLRPYRLQK